MANALLAKLHGQRTAQISYPRRKRAMPGDRKSHIGRTSFLRDPIRVTCETHDPLRSRLPLTGNGGRPLDAGSDRHGT